MYTITEESSGRKIFVSAKELALIESKGYFLEDVIGYDDIEAIANRATIKELLDFANTVREAGGGEIIDEIMPSYPEDPHSCLIANALNFNCSVQGHSYGWRMEVDDEELANKIALAIDSAYEYSEINNNKYSIALPTDIGYVAAAFDTYRDVELEHFNIDSKTI